MRAAAREAIAATGEAKAATTTDPATKSQWQAKAQGTIASRSIWPALFPVVASPAHDSADIESLANRGRG